MTVMRAALIVALVRSAVSTSSLPEHADISFHQLESWTRWERPANEWVGQGSGASASVHAGTSSGRRLSGGDTTGASSKIDDDPVDVSGIIHA